MTVFCQLDITSIESTIKENVIIVHLGSDVDLCSVGFLVLTGYLECILLDNTEYISTRKLYYNTAFLRDQ